MDVSGTFNLPVSVSWAQSQTRRVELNCLTAGGTVTINLPSIADIKAVNGGNVELVVNDADGNAGANNITVVADAGAGDTLEGGASHVVSVNDESNVYVIGNDSTWVIL